MGFLIRFRNDHPGESFFIFSVLMPLLAAVGTYLSFCFAFVVKFGISWGIIASKMLLVDTERYLVSVVEMLYKKEGAIWFLTPRQFLYLFLCFFIAAGLSMIDWPIHNRQKREQLESEYGKSWWIGDKW